MEKTGHQIIEGVRSYKRTSELQREALSDILNRSAQAIQVQPTGTADTCLAPVHTREAVNIVKKAAKQAP